MGVCVKCIEDPTLQEIVKDNLTEKWCDYCGREAKKPIACELRVIANYMKEYIEREYCDPVEELPFESAEGGYQGMVLDAWDVLEAIGFRVKSERLFDDIGSSLMDHDWCEKTSSSRLESDAYVYGWQRFCRAVKNQRRYTFWTAYDKNMAEYDRGYIHPGEMLKQISEVIRYHATTLPPGTRFWRVQVLDAAQKPKLPHRFTSPPDDLALNPNRMSPAGVSMFYGAADMRTALKETVRRRSRKKRVWAVQFESLIGLTLLDLTSLPDMPSYFSRPGHDPEVLFLQFFKRDLTRPVVADRCEHIDYVPTQVFTEYVRYEMRTSDGKPFHGIIYPSSKTGKPCYVIFANQEDCLDEVQYRLRSRPQILRLVPDSLTEA